MLELIPYLRAPIVQAPMAGVTKPAMVIAACKAGIIGSHGGGMLSPDQLRTDIREIREAVGDKPFNINLFVLDSKYADSTYSYAFSADEKSWVDSYYEKQGLHAPSSNAPYAPDFEKQFEVIMAEKPPIASFAFGIINSEQVTALKRRNIKMVGTATNVKEAIEWARIGADAIVAQGSEAGGHRGGWLDSGVPGMGTIKLVSAIRNEVPHVPVIAAGGIVDGKGLFEAVDAGAAMAQVGTPFLFGQEAGLNSTHIRGLQEAQATAFTKGFTGRYARGVVNSFMQYAEGKPTAPYPIQNRLTQPLRADSAKRGSWESMSLWAGEGLTTLPRQVEPVATIAERLAKQYNQFKSKA